MPKKMITGTSTVAELINAVAEIGQTRSGPIEIDMRIGQNTYKVRFEMLTVNGVAVTTRQMDANQVAKRVADKATSMDDEILMERYHKRKAENKGKRVDNSKLRAGLPMYYYCRHCDVLTQTLPESHVEQPVTICDACQVLANRGLLPEKQ